MIGLGNDGRLAVVHSPPSPPRGEPARAHRLKSRESWNGVRANDALHAAGVVVFNALMPSAAFDVNALHNRTGKCLACSSRRCHVYHPPHDFEIGAHRTKTSLHRRAAPNIAREEHPVRLRNFRSAEEAAEANALKLFDDAMMLADRTLLQAERRDTDRDGW